MTTPPMTTPPMATPPVRSSLPGDDRLRGRRSATPAPRRRRQLTLTAAVVSLLTALRLATVFNR